MRLLPRHPGMMVLAIALACLVWYTQALERRERISEKQLDTSVTFVNVPPDMIISSDAPRTLLLRVRGPLSKLRQLEPSQTGVVIDLRGAGEGQRDYAVEGRNVVVPAGVEVIAVSPSQVPVRLERVVRRRLPVKPRVVGQPASGFAVGSINVEPATVRVSGPRLQLESLQAVVTEPVSVDGAEGPVEAVVAVRSPYPLVRVEEPLAVRVVIQMTPKRGEPRGGKRR
ncbi:MAG: YbbR-like domain-containing protein [Acidobacteriota bacterium]